MENDSFFNFQLDLIKKEIDQIQEIIGRIDIISQQIKNWTILIWAGSISLIFGQTNNDLRKIIFIVAVIPLLFWIVDAHYKRRQRIFMYRNVKISAYLNSKEFQISFQKKQIQEFILMDLKGKHYDFNEVKKYANVKRTLWFYSLRAFYLGLILVTVFLQFFLFPGKIDNQPNVNLHRTNQDSILVVGQERIIKQLEAMRIRIDSLHNNK